jgi:hypothetical protein
MAVVCGGRSTKDASMVMQVLMVWALHWGSQDRRFLAAANIIFPDSAYPMT